MASIREERDLEEPPVGRIEADIRSLSRRSRGRAREGVIDKPAATAIYRHTIYRLS